MKVTFESRVCYDKAMSGKIDGPFKSEQDAIDSAAIHFTEDKSLSVYVLKITKELIFSLKA